MLDSMTTTGSLVRHYNARLLNSIANDASVINWIVPYGAPRPLDFTPAVMDLRNVLLMNGFGGFLYHWQEPGVYEVHSQMLPAGRGTMALNAAHESLDYMFTRTDAVEIVTKIPAGNDAARTLALACGFRHDFMRPKAWPMGPDDIRDIGCYVLTWRDWLRHAQWLVAEGEWFHRRIEQLLGEAAHAADSVHDRAVGATIAMILGGQLDKAIAIYNRWARLAGYGTIAIVSRMPIALDIGNAVVLLETEPVRRLELLMKRGA